MCEHIEMDEAFSKLASLIGEKSRAKMLWHLLDGRGYTAFELALIADISKQACSNHLKKLTANGILLVHRQGRHKYFRLSNAKVARALEGIAFLVGIPNKPDSQIQPASLKTGIQFARSCYDHLAGYMGVALTDAMLQQRFIHEKDNTYHCTDTGIYKLQELGIDIDTLNRQNRKFAYPCLDWSERKPHIGGALGAALFKHMIAHDWLRKRENSRGLILTTLGQKELENHFKLRTTIPAGL